MHLSFEAGTSLVGGSMSSHIQAAGIAALFIFLAFAMHLTNMFYFEPRMGFDGVRDYAYVPQLLNGLRSPSWLWSGYGHFATGVALVVVTAVLVQWSRVRAATGAALTGIVGTMAALAFLLNGLIDLQGSSILFAIDAGNPGHTEAYVGSSAILRNTVNVAAIVLLGWFIVQLTWTLRGIGKLPFGFALLSYITGLVAFWLFRTPTVYLAAYVLIPVWALLFGLILYTKADSLGQFDEKYL
jgi:hypothetical protein